MDSLIYIGIACFAAAAILGFEKIISSDKSNKHDNKSFTILNGFKFGLGFACGVVIINLVLVLLFFAWLDSQSQQANPWNNINYIER